MIKILLSYIFIVCLSCDTSKSYNQLSENETVHVQWTFYHSNGTVQRVETFSGSEKQGVWMTYDIDGRLIKQEKYRAGKLESEKNF